MPQLLQDNPLATDGNRGEDSEVRDPDEIKHSEHCKENEQTDDDLFEGRRYRHARQREDPSDKANECNDYDECDEHFGRG